MGSAAKALICVVALAGLAGVPAKATTIALVANAGWDAFYFGDAIPADDDSYFQDLNDDPLDFTFTLGAQGGTLQIADGYFDGDQFQITINGVNVGDTSEPVFDGTYVGNDYDAALANSDFSSAIYALGKGTYDVTGSVIVSPYGIGAGGISLLETAAPAPEPAAWATMLLGLGLAGGALRRRKASFAA